MLQAAWRDGSGALRISVCAGGAHNKLV